MKQLQKSVIYMLFFIFVIASANAIDFSIINEGNISGKALGYDRNNGIIITQMTPSWSSTILNSSGVIRYDISGQYFSEMSNTSGTPFNANGDECEFSPIGKNYGKRYQKIGTDQLYTSGGRVYKWNSISRQWIPSASTSTDCYIPASCGYAQFLRYGGSFTTNEVDKDYNLWAMSFHNVCANIGSGFCLADTYFAYNFTTSNIQTYVCNPTGSQDATIFQSSMDIPSYVPTILEASHGYLNRTPKTFVTITNNRFYNGWYDYDNSITYSLEPQDIVISNSYKNLSSDARATLMGTPCTDITTLPSVNFYDIACSSKTECYVVGKFNTANSLLFKFSGTTCEYYDLTTKYNTTNKPLTNIIYVPDKNAYYIVGNKIFFSLSSTSIISNLSSTLGISLYGTNSKIVTSDNGVQTIYVYPLLEGSSVITGYYALSINEPTTYMGVTCDYTEQILLNDTINYPDLNLSAHGWTTGTCFANFTCGYEVGIFDTTYGFSMLMNGSKGYIGSITKALTPLSANKDAYISFDARPIKSALFGQEVSEQYFILKDSLNSQILYMQYEWNNTAQTNCIYYYNPAKTLMFCNSETNPTTFLHTDLYLSAIQQSWTIKVSGIGTDIYSVVVPSLNAFANIGYIEVGVTSDSTGYYDNFIVRQIPTYPSLVFQNVNYNVTTDIASWNFQGCDYSTIKCYKSRFYYQLDNTQAYNRYEDFDLCSSLSSTNPSGSGSGTTGVNNFLDDLFGSDLNMSQKVTMATLILIVIFITCLIVLWTTTGEGKLSAVVSTALTSVAFIIFAVTGYYPAWITILIIIFVAGVIMIFGRSVVTGG